MDCLRLQVLHTRARRRPMLAVVVDWRSRGVLRIAVSCRNVIGRKRVHRLVGTQDMSKFCTTCTISVHRECAIEQANRSHRRNGRVLTKINNAMIVRFGTTRPTAPVRFFGKLCPRTDAGGCVLFSEYAERTAGCGIPPAGRHARSSGDSPHRTFVGAGCGKFERAGQNLAAVDASWHFTCTSPFTIPRG